MVPFMRNDHRTTLDCINFITTQSMLISKSQQSVCRDAMAPRGPKIVGTGTRSSALKPMQEFSLPMQRPTLKP
jgi:hypothetical protein